VSTSGPTATIDGLDTSLATAIEQAGGLLRQARRVLVTGLCDASLEAIAAACDLAETLGAAVDAAAAETASPAGPILPRSGGVTADLGELRDRADLVITWFCDPPAVRSLDDKLSPQPRHRPRRLVAVGPDPISGQEHWPLPAESAVDAARLLHIMLAGHPTADRPFAAALAVNCQALTDAIRAAECVGFLIDCDRDPLGLEVWALARAVRCLAHEKPAFMVPLAHVAPGQLANAAGAAALLTWRYGAGGGIARADRLGSSVRPAECDAVSLIARGEVDVVVAVGQLPASTEAAIADRAADLSVVRFDCHAGEPPGAAGCCVHVRLSEVGGTILGQDGREMPAGRSAPKTDSLVSLLVLLRDRLVEAAP
jgi:formylmethanofuran dehydrogenase subunit B